MPNYNELVEHYFIKDIVFRKKADGIETDTPYQAAFHVRDLGDNQYIYSFSMSKIKESQDKLETQGSPSAEPPLQTINTSISNSNEKVNTLEKNNLKKHGLPMRFALDRRLKQSLCLSKNIISKTA